MDVENVIDGFEVPDANDEKVIHLVQLVETLLSDDSHVYDIWIGSDIKIWCPNKAEAQEKLEKLQFIMEGFCG